MNLTDEQCRRLAVLVEQERDKLADDAVRLWMAGRPNAADSAREQAKHLTRLLDQAAKEPTK